MQLGSSWKDIEAAYADALYLEDEGLEQYKGRSGIVAGSLFGGLTFSFDEDQDGVNSIALGRVADGRLVCGRGAIAAASRAKKNCCS